MKLVALLLLLLVSQIYTDECTNKYNPSGESDCTSLKVSEGYFKCCYVYTKGSVLGVNQESKECEHINQAQYDNIETIVDTQIKAIEAMGGKVDKFSIECSSKYLVLSIFSLLFLL